MCQIAASKQKSIRYVLGVSAWVLMQNIGFSLPEDQKQLLQLRANSAEVSQQSHRGVYLGDVQFDQGTTHLRAAEAITEGNEKNQLIKAIIKGNSKEPAHYWTLPASDKPLFHAYADTIYYYPNTHLIELIGHARVQQGDNSFSAPNIRYDTQHQHIVSKNNGASRTTIILHPEKHS